MKTTCIIRSAALAVVALFLCSCDEEEEKYQLHFSHYLHVEDMGMECADCHGELGDFQVISHANCIDCHDEPEAGQITPETCGMCHVQDKLYTLKLVDTNATKKAVAPSVFVHTEAFEDRCVECHGALMDEEVELVPRLQRKEILAIRETAHQSAQDCQACHVGLARNVEPSSHDAAWQRRHGQLGMQSDAACAVCHTQDSCMECHSVMQPMSHNNTFRTRTHGIMAATDRQTCQVCHVEDSCTSCHTSTRPRSHNARWAASGTRPTHCISCHNTSTPGDGCVTCHEGGNDITLHAQYWGGASFDHSKLSGESCYICHWTSTP